MVRDLGVRIALDDFGTGFSSLSYLRSFPFDKIKIDQSFIAGLADGNEESLAIVDAVARLGASLGVATTAEGVETQLQHEIARREGFTEAQGGSAGRRAPPRSRRKVISRAHRPRSSAVPRQRSRQGPELSNRRSKQVRSRSARGAPRSVPVRLVRRSSLGGRAGLDGELSVRAPLRPASVVDGGVGLAEHGQR